jgi:hypothetical protein
MLCMNNLDLPNGTFLAFSWVFIKFQPRFGLVFLSCRTATFNQLQTGELNIKPETDVILTDR